MTFATHCAVLTVYVLHLNTPRVCSAVEYTSICQYTPKIYVCEFECLFVYRRVWEKFAQQSDTQIHANENQLVSGGFAGGGEQSEPAARRCQMTNKTCTCTHTRALNGTLTNVPTERICLCCGFIRTQTHTIYE